MWGHLARYVGAPLMDEAAQDVNWVISAGHSKVAVLPGRYTILVLGIHD